jgi:hypothetical protein
MLYGTKKRIAAGILLSAMTLAVISGCNKPTSPSSTPTGFQISSLSATQAAPTSVLTLAGSGFGPASGLLVRFSDSSGYRVDVQVFQANSNSASVCVPPYFAPTTGASRAGTVSVRLLQTSGSGVDTSNAIAGFRIRDLPPSGALPGSITLAFLNSEAVYYDSLQNRIKATLLDSASSSIASARARLATLITQVQTIVSDPTATFLLGTINGKTITMNSAALLQSDRLILAMIGSVNRPDFYDVIPTLAKRWFLSSSAACPTDLTSNNMEDWQDCSAQLPVQSVEKGFKFILGVGAVAVGVLVLAGLTPAELALSSCALLYIGVMASGTQLSLGALLKNVNTAAAYQALKNGIEATEALLDNPVKGRASNEVFKEAAGTLKEIWNGIQLIKESLPQPAGACTYEILQKSRTFDSTGGSGTISVNAGSGCPWTAEVDNVDWIAVTSNASGSGPGVVGYSVQPNSTTSQRSGSIFAAGKEFAIVQNGKKGSNPALPPGFPANVPTGTYTVSVTLIINGTSSTGQSFTVTNTDISAFAQALVSSMNTVTSQWSAACQQTQCECGAPTVTYTAWNGTSFTVAGSIVVTSAGDCLGGGATATYTVTKQ